MRSLLALASSAVMIAASCGGATSPVPDATDGGASSGGSSGGSSGSSGGSDAGGEGGPPGVACTSDPECNEVLEMQSLAGSCFMGVCICKTGYFVQPDGKCGKNPPPGCVAQGGTCHQMPAECPAGTLGTDGPTDMSCGDFAAAVCCFAPAACKGPTFTCCAPNDAALPQICENGWRTCPPGGAPGPCG